MASPRQVSRLADTRLEKLEVGKWKGGSGKNLLTAAMYKILE